MIYDATYLSQEAHDEINRTLGRPYGLMDVLTQGVTESERMIVFEGSKGFVGLAEYDHDATSATIELRPRGILVLLSNNHNRMRWVIPYHQLTVYKTDGLSLHCNGEFLRLQVEKKHLAFIKKVQLQRIKYFEQYSFSL